MTKIQKLDGLGNSRVQQMCNDYLIKWLLKYPYLEIVGMRITKKSFIIEYTTKSRIVVHRQIVPLHTVASVADGMKRVA